MKRLITTVDNREAALVGEVHGVLVTDRLLTTELFRLVVRSSSYELIVRRTTRENMPATNDFENDVTCFRHNQGTTRTPLVAEGTIAGGNVGDKFTSNEETDDEEITGEEVDEELKDDLKCVEEELVLMLNNENCERSE